MEMHHSKTCSLGGWMKENVTDDWTMGAHIANSQINEHAIEARGNQVPLELTFGERPKFDDALRKVAGIIRAEQAFSNNRASGILLDQTSHHANQGP